MFLLCDILKRWQNALTLLYDMTIDRKRRMKNNYHCRHKIRRNCVILFPMASTTKSPATSIQKGARSVSFRDVEFIHEIPCILREGEVLANKTKNDASLVDTISESDKSKLWYTDEDISRWRDDASHLVANFLRGRNTSNIIVPPHDEQVVCLRGLEHLVHSEMDNTTFSTVDVVLIAQRQQQKRGFRDEVEIAAACSIISANSQRDAIERARKDFEVAQRDHDVSDRHASLTKTHSNQEWESARPKRRRNSCNSMLRMFRRTNRLPKNISLELQRPK
jgi:hypothetical protein